VAQLLSPIKITSAFLRKRRHSFMLQKYVVSDTIQHFLITVCAAAAYF